MASTDINNFNFLVRALCFQIQFLGENSLFLLTVMQISQTFNKYLAHDLFLETTKLMQELQLKAQEINIL